MAGARDFKGGRAIYRFDAMTGAASELAPGRQNSRVEVSPDGRKIYYDYHPEYRGAYVEVDVETGATREVFQKPAGVEDGRKELSPDGRYVATVTLARDNKEQKAGGDSYGDESSVLLIPVAGGEPRKLQSVSRPERFWPYGGLTWAPGQPGGGRIEGYRRRGLGVPQEGTLARPGRRWPKPASLTSTSATGI